MPRAAAMPTRTLPSSRSLPRARGSSFTARTGVRSGAGTHRRFSSPKSSRESNAQSDGAHELEAVTLSDHAVAEFEVELHPALEDVILEMNVAHRTRSDSLELRQGEIVRARKPDRSALDERPQDRLGADEPVLRVRPLQHLIEQEQ